MIIYRAWLWLLSTIRFLHRLLDSAVRWWEDTVLYAIEEWVLSLIRQAFEEGARFLHALSSSFLSVLQLPESWERNPWQLWWHQAQNRDGTLNAFIAAESEKRGATDESDPDPAAAAASGLVSAAAASAAQSSSHSYLGSFTRRGSSSRGVSRRLLRSMSSLFSFNHWSGSRRRPAGPPSADVSPSKPAAPPSASMRQRTTAKAADKIELPTGLDLVNVNRTRGLLEDLKMAVQLRVTYMFGFGRAALRTILFLPPRELHASGRHFSPAYAPAAPQTSATTATTRREIMLESSLRRSFTGGSQFVNGVRSTPPGRSIRRTHSFSAVEDAHRRDDGTSITGAFIRLAGYPCEMHTVTTADGYILRMERLPRVGGRDVVFFMHGILDTSLAWVTAGVTASQAFAAWDAGFDVWLGNSRSNAPRSSTDPTRTGLRYWEYNCNQMGVHDVGAQVDYIDSIKCRERLGRHVLLAKDCGPKARSAVSVTGPARPTSAPRNSRPDATDEWPLELSAGGRGGGGDALRLSQRSVSSVLSATDSFNTAATLGDDFGSAQSESVADDEDDHDLTDNADAEGSDAEVGAFLAAGERLTANSNGGSFSRKEKGAPPSAVAASDALSSGARSPANGSSGAASGAASSSCRSPASKSANGGGGAGSNQHSGGGGHSSAHNGGQRGTVTWGSADVAETQSGSTGRSSMRHRGVERLTDDPARPVYKLRAVGHSLGGMSLLIYLVTRRREGRPHHLSRAILLTPAGFHNSLPYVELAFCYGMPPIFWLGRRLFRHFAFPLYIPTFLARALMFKLVVDISRNPSLGQLLKIMMKVVMGGDASEWDRAMLLPHYNAHDMPGISAELLLHLTQSYWSKRFRMFDYGAARNKAEYGTPTPPEVSQDYGLIDIPVDLVAGEQDGVIPPHNIRLHHQALKQGGVRCSYREFDFGHLDFTFAVKEELKMYILRLIKK